MEFKIGQSIKVLRKNRNISQARLGIALGVSRAQVANWESDRREITLKDAILVAEYFNITVNDFIELGR